MSLNKKKLGHVFVCMLVLASLLSCSCSTKKNLTVSNTLQSKERKINDDETKFQSLKEKGIKAIDEDRLSEGIAYLRDAQNIKQDDLISKKLEEAYIERAEYYFSIGKSADARLDLLLCISMDEKVVNLGLKIDPPISTTLKLPYVNAVCESTEVYFVWDTIKYADYYEILLEDNSWKKLKSDTSIVANYNNSKVLKFGNVYYWTVRAHYPNKTWGPWATKSWFSVRKSNPTPTPSNTETSTNFNELPVLKNPLNEEKLTKTSLSFIWWQVVGATSYEIQIEDQNWKLVVSKKTKEPNYYTENELNFDNVYYWRVRPIYANMESGEWSEKKWFSIRHPRPAIDVFAETCKRIPYKELARYPEKYRGQNVYFKGKVVQVMEDGSNLIMRVDVTVDEYGWYDDTVYMVFNGYNGEARILEDDIVLIYGIADGIETYTALLGSDVSIPRVIVKFLKLQK